MQALPAGSAAAAAAVLPPAGAAASPAASPVRDRSLDDDDDNTHSGSKRRRRPAAQEINQSGLALASNGQALLIQPHAVWQAYAKANPDMTTNRPTAFERYELCVSGPAMELCGAAFEDASVLVQCMPADHRAISEDRHDDSAVLNTDASPSAQACALSPPARR